MLIKNKIINFYNKLRNKKIKIIAIHEREKYKSYFYKRFKYKSRISMKKNEADFFIDFIDEIEQQYLKEIDLNIKDKPNYLKNEKIRLETKIKCLESDDLDIPLKYINIIFPIIISIITFSIGLIFSGSNNSAMFAAQNKINFITNANETVNNTISENIDAISKIYTDYINNIMKYISEILPQIIIFACVPIILIQIIHVYNLSKRNREIAFYRYCLKILETINQL